MVRNIFTDTVLVSNQMLLYVPQWKGKVTPSDLTGLLNKDPYRRPLGLEPVSMHSIRLRVQ